MESLKLSLIRVIRSAIGTFKLYPAANANALGFTVITMIRIQLDWNAQEPYNFLFNVLHLSFTVGIFVSLAALAFVHQRHESRKSFLWANIIGIAAAVLAFLGLYFFGADPANAPYSLYESVSSIAAGRAMVVVLTSVIGFIVIIGLNQAKSSLSKSLFLYQKAFIIACLYGGVLMAGVSGIAGAIQALLYPEMSEKVYQYLGATVLFIAFTLFEAQFPDLRQQASDDDWEPVQKQPPFIQILFGSILVPLLLALTVVLIAWTGKSALSGEWPSFMQLSSIAVSYAFFGIWLHVMVTDYDTAVARLYKKLFPFAGLYVLIFELWALVRQLNQFGMKTNEYTFIMVWLVAIVSVVLLILLKAAAHRWIALAIVVVSVLGVVPVLGYQDLPIQLQVNRLEKLLESSGILKDNKLSPASGTVAEATKIAVTDSVLFLSYSRSEALPSWFEDQLSDGTVFKKTFGFEQTWPKVDGVDLGQNQMNALYLTLPNEPLSVSGYDWVVSMQQFQNMNNESVAEIKGQKGTYKLTWGMPSGQVPVFKVAHNDQLIINETMKTYLEGIVKQYPPSPKGEQRANLEDLIVKFETQEISVMLVLSNINVTTDPMRDEVNYWVNIHSVYLKEK